MRGLGPSDKFNAATFIIDILSIKAYLNNIEVQKELVTKLFFY